MTETTKTKKITKIVVEGPDCSGKSTLVERLKNVLHWDSKYLRHRNGDQYARYLKEYAGEEIVLDRSHFSEEVYSNLWRGGSPFSDEEKDILDKAAAVNSIVIFAIPSLSVLKERHGGRDFEQQITIDELEKSRELFIGELKKVKAIHYESRDYDELEALLVTIKEMIG